MEPNTCDQGTREFAWSPAIPDWSGENLGIGGESDLGNFASEMFERTTPRTSPWARLVSTSPPTIVRWNNANVPPCQLSEPPSLTAEVLVHQIKTRRKADGTLPKCPRNMTRLEFHSVVGADVTDDSSRNIRAAIGKTSDRLDTIYFNKQALQTEVMNKVILILSQ